MLCAGFGVIFYGAAASAVLVSVEGCFYATHHLPWVAVGLLLGFFCHY